MTTITHLKPFIPSGADFRLARSFFVDLGFVVNWETAGLAELQLSVCRRKEHRTRIFRINADLKQTFIKKSAKISAQSVRVPFGFSVASPTGC